MDDDKKDVTLINPETTATMIAEITKEIPVAPKSSRDKQFEDEVAVAGEPTPGRKVVVVGLEIGNKLFGEVKDLLNKVGVLAVRPDSAKDNDEVLVEAHSQGALSAVYKLAGKQM